MKNILSVFSLCAFVLTAAEPRLGSSLSAVFGYSGEPVTQADLDQIARSEIASFEIYHATFTGKNQPIKAAFLEMLRKSGKAAQSYHLPFGPEVDLSAADETMRENAVRSLKGYLKDAASFGCEYVVLHASDGKIPPETRAARIAAARKSLATVSAILPKSCCCCWKGCRRSCSASASTSITVSANQPHRRKTSGCCAERFSGFTSATTTEIWSVIGCPAPEPWTSRRLRPRYGRSITGAFILTRRTFPGIPSGNASKI